MWRCHERAVQALPSEKQLQRDPFSSTWPGQSFSPTLVPKEILSKPACGRICAHILCRVHYDPAACGQFCELTL